MSKTFNSKDKKKQERKRRDDRRTKRSIPQPKREKGDV